MTGRDRIPQEPQSKSGEGWLVSRTRLMACRKAVGGVAIALPKSQRPDRVPRVRAALATVEMHAVFERELALEGFERRLLFIAREVE